MSMANVGGADRVIRIVIGIILIAAPYFLSLAIWENQSARVIIQIIGAVLLITGLIRFCGLYKILGIRTNS